MVRVQLQGTLDVERISGVEEGDAVVLDLEGVTFTRPSGLVAVACIARNADSLQIIWPIDRDQRVYMSRMELDVSISHFHPSIELLPRVRHRPAELCEASFFEEAMEVERLCDLIADQAKAAQIPVDHSIALEEGAWEICDNAITHSTWAGGGVLAAQYYPARSEVEYAVADAGIGILKSLATEYPDLESDADAIGKAREYGVSRFGQDRRGAGLAETVDQVIGLGGRVVVRSGSATVKFSRRRTRVRELREAWPGTLLKAVLKVR
jgi:hypothetical protein